VIKAYATPTYSVAGYNIAHVRPPAIKKIKWDAISFLFYFCCRVILFYFILHVQLAQKEEEKEGGSSGCGSNYNDSYDNKTG